MKKTTLIKLADGNEHKLSSLNLGDMIDIEKTFGSLEMDTKRIESIAYWIWLSLKKDNPNLSLEQSYELIDMPFMADGGTERVILAITKINGMDKAAKNVESPVEEELA